MRHEITMTHAICSARDVGTGANNHVPASRGPRAACWPRVWYPSVILNDFFFHISTDNNKISCFVVQLCDFPQYILSVIVHIQQHDVRRVDKCFFTPIRSFFLKRGWTMTFWFLANGRFTFPLAPQIKTLCSVPTSWSLTSAHCQACSSCLCMSVAVPWPACDWL